MVPQVELFLFVFLGELNAPKRHFKINWPLKLIVFGMISVGMIQITQMDYMVSTVCIMDQQLRYNNQYVLIRNGPMGTSINDVPRFLAFFDLPTYLCPIWSLLEKAAYLMTSFFVWPTLPNFFLRSNSNYSNFRLGQFFA